MLDIGSDYNLIDKSFIAENVKLEESTVFPGLTAISNLPIRTFSIYPLYIKTRDTLGHKYIYILCFIVANIMLFTVLLS